MRGLVSVNGVTTPLENAKISALSRGFLFGDAIYETMVAFGPKVLDVERHLGRLRASAEAMGFEVPWSNEVLAFEIQSLAEALSAPKQLIRLVVSRGIGGGLLPTDDLTPERVLYCQGAPIQPQLYQSGVALKRVLARGVSRGPQAKVTGTYVTSVRQLAKAQGEGFDDILWTNSEGEITEASSANIFFLARIGDQVEIVTPPPASGLLLGLTRATMLTLFQQAGIKAHEQTVFADELPRFDEAFLCSSVKGLVPVNRIDRHKLHTARSGAIFRQLARLFHAWVARELSHKVDWVTGRPE